MKNVTGTTFFIRGSSLKPVTFINNLVAFNTGETLQHPPPQPTLGRMENNIVFGNKSSTGATSFPIFMHSSPAQPIVYDHNLSDFKPQMVPMNLAIGSHNLLSADPGFAAADSTDFHLAPCSPAVNAGDNLPWAGIAGQFDIDGNPRILDGLIDIDPIESDSLRNLVVEKTRPSCGADSSGAVRFLVEKGCGPFQFFWKKGTSTGTDTAHLATGEYQFTLTDARGKPIFSNVEIAGSNLATNISGYTMYCFGAHGTNLAATVTGGEPPLETAWNTGDTSPLLENATTGSYFFKVKDAAGCLAADSVLVGELPATIAQFTVNDASSATASDGSSILNLISGQPPFAFAWSNGDSTGNPTGLAPGPYSITISNAMGCTAAYGFVVGYTVSAGNVLGNRLPGIFPNPTGGDARIDWGGFERLEIWDVSGRLLMSKKRGASGETVSVAGLPVGVFTLKWIWSGEPVFQKLTVQKCAAWPHFPQKLISGPAGQGPATGASPRAGRASPCRAT